MQVKKSLKPEQLKAIALIVSRDVNGMTYKQIADEIGVAESTIFRWKEKDYFVDELNRQAELMQRAFLSEAYNRLRGIITNPHTADNNVLKALELFMKNQGKLKTVEESTVEVKTESAEDILKDLGL